MAKGAGQKAKLLALEHIFLEQTDEEHPISVARMMELLKTMGVECRDRKSLYDDLETLRLFGMDIESIRTGRSVGYYLASRSFELPELKLLVDAVQSSRFITRDKTDRLIRKLESLTSVHQARQLQRQVFVTHRVKTGNERVYYIVDALHGAIDGNKQIRFHYYEWARGASGRLEQRLRRDGSWYQVSPWALLWDKEYYYLVAYEAASDQLRHYRVDKMLDMETLDLARLGAEQFQGQDPGVYAASMFGMFAGKQQSLRLLVDNSLAGVIVDRFGQDVITAPCDEGHFTVNVRAAVSPQFFSWVFSFGGKCRILSPDTVLMQYRQMLRNSMEAEEDL